jgi:hypothetical protein
VHTHAHVESQFGALIWATAKPEKKTKNASGAARHDILCPAALWVVGLKVTGDGARKELIDGRVRRNLLIIESFISRE